MARVARALVDPVTLSAAARVRPSALASVRDPSPVRHDSCTLCCIRAAASAPKGRAKRKRNRIRPVLERPRAENSGKSRTDPPPVHAEASD